MTPQQSHEQAVSLLAKLLANKEAAFYIRYLEGTSIPAAICLAGFDIIHLQHTERTVNCLAAFLERINDRIL